MVTISGFKSQISIVWFIFRRVPLGNSDFSLEGKEDDRDHAVNRDKETRSGHLIASFSGDIKTLVMTTSPLVWVWGGFEALETLCDGCEVL